MENYQKVANKENLTTEQRVKYFTLGAAIQNRKTVKLGFKYSVEAAHETALVYLQTANWKMKTAKALLTVTRAW